MRYACILYNNVLLRLRQISCVLVQWLSNSDHTHKKNIYIITHIHIVIYNTKYILGLCPVSSTELLKPLESQKW